MPTTALNQRKNTRSVFIIDSKTFRHEKQGKRGRLTFHCQTDKISVCGRKFFIINLLKLPKEVTLPHIKKGCEKINYPNFAQDFLFLDNMLVGLLTILIAQRNILLFIYSFNHWYAINPRWYIHSCMIWRFCHL